MSIMTRFTRPLLLVAAAALSTQAGAAQRVDPNRVFDITLQVNGQVMTATVREGGTFRLTLHEVDEYRLVPVAGGNERTVTLAVYRGTAGQPSTSRIVEHIQVAVGRSATLRTNPAFTLVVDGIRSAPPRQAAAPQSISFAVSASWRRAVQSDNCCVCCGGACACACGVVMSCGSCCMPGCCSINETSAPGRGGDESRRAAALAAFLGGSACDSPFRPASGELRIASR